METQQSTTRRPDQLETTRYRECPQCELPYRQDLEFRAYDPPMGFCSLDCANAHYEQSKGAAISTATYSPTTSARIERDSAEWNHAWSELFAAPENAGHTVEADRNADDRWQYMGTHQYPSGNWFHEFRHRNHPAAGKRLYLNIPASAEFIPTIERPAPTW
jgi:hypothetical protein